MASAPFRNVALLGATGKLGSHILKALTNANFNTTAIQRLTSTNAVPSPAHSLKIDLSSVSALTSAFQNQDIVVSALPNPVLSSDSIWIEAAIAAGVKRIVLSEFSTNIDNELSKKLPIVIDKVEIREYVERLAGKGKLEWMSVNNGPFLENFIWLSGWMGPNPKKMFTTIHDGGDKIVCTSSLARIAEGVVNAILPENAEKTKNQSLYVYSAPMSENKMTKIVAKVLGIDEKKFKRKEVDIEALMKETWDGFHKGQTGWSKMMNFYVPFCFGEGYGGDYRGESGDWNERLGLKVMSDEEIEEVVRGWVAK